MKPLGPNDPQRVGQYRLLGKLGAGGMGSVYLARSDRGRTVAVKLVQPELARQPEFRQRFKQEVDAARRIGGEFTAPVLGGDTEAETPWVATGYVAGPSLHEVVASTYGNLPERTLRILANGLVKALRDIHAAGMVHRDLKPSNVLITIDGPRVIDFGIARALEGAGEGLTRTGAAVGSPGFMSPEQCRGESVTGASDIFCLGSVLTFSATGRTPFGDANSPMTALMLRIVQGEKELDGVPEGIRGLVESCLAQEPEHRPSLDQLLRWTEPPPDSEEPDDEPWLPGALIAKLGRHAVELLDSEDPLLAPPPPAMAPPPAMPSAPPPPTGAALTPPQPPTAPPPSPPPPRTPPPSPAPSPVPSPPPSPAPSPAPGTPPPSPPPSTAGAQAMGHQTPPHQQQHGGQPGPCGAPAGGYGYPPRQPGAPDGYGYPPQQPGGPRGAAYGGGTPPPAAPNTPYHLGQVPPSGSRRSSGERNQKKLLWLIVGSAALAVTLIVGITVFVLANGDKDDEGKGGEATTPPPTDPATTEPPTDPPTTGTETSSPVDTQITVPTEMIAAWEGEITDTSGEETGVFRRVEISSGVIGSEVATTWNVYPEVMCKGSGELLDGDDKVQITVSSEITATVPSTGDPETGEMCTAYGEQTMELQSDGSLLWMNEDDGLQAVMQQATAADSDAMPSSHLGKYSGQVPNGPAIDIAVETLADPGDLAATYTGKKCTWEAELVSGMPDGDTAIYGPGEVTKGDCDPLPAYRVVAINSGLDGLEFTRLGEGAPSFTADFESYF